MIIYDYDRNLFSCLHDGVVPNLWEHPCVGLFILQLRERSCAVHGEILKGGCRGSSGVLLLQGATELGLQKLDQAFQIGEHLLLPRMDVPNPYLSLALLGGFEATFDAEPITGFVTNKDRTLLAFLAVEAFRPHRRAELATMFWPDASEKKAAPSLSQGLSHLRKALGGNGSSAVPFLLITSQDVQFNGYSEYHLDLEAVEQLASYCEERNKWALVQEYSRRQIALEPWRETAHHRLMSALVQPGMCLPWKLRMRSVSPPMEKNGNERPLRHLGSRIAAVSPDGRNLLVGYKERDKMMDTREDLWVADAQAVQRARSAAACLQAMTNITSVFDREMMSFSTLSTAGISDW